MMKRRIGIILILLLVVGGECADAHKRLVFAVDLIRHGDRTPVIELPKAIHHWQVPLGELTPIGMKQEYLLGRSMRKRYVEEYHLLPKHYHNEMMYVRSSDFNRTLMSAQCFLLGLYPIGTGAYKSHSRISLLPFGFQPIPIHTVDKRADNLLLTSHHPFTPSKLPNELTAKSNEWYSKTGYRVSTSQELVGFADNLMIRELNQVALPRGISHQEAHEIIAQGRKTFTDFYQDPAVGKLQYSDLLRVILDHFEKAQTPSHQLRYILYSAHDSTLLGVFSALHNPLSTPPPYASILSFLLFENEGRLSVSLFYNGNPVALNICKLPLSCELAELKKIL